MPDRPEFSEIEFYDEFSKYYWYSDELSLICKSLGINHYGTKQELNDCIREYFKGNYIPQSQLLHIDE